MYLHQSHLRHRLPVKRLDGCQHQNNCKNWIRSKNHFPNSTAKMLILHRNRRNCHRPILPKQNQKDYSNENIDFLRHRRLATHFRAHRRTNLPQNKNHSKMCHYQFQNLQLPILQCQCIGTRV